MTIDNWMKGVKSIIKKHLELDVADNELDSLIYQHLQIAMRVSGDRTTLSSDIGFTLFYILEQRCMQLSNISHCELIRLLVSTFMLSLKVGSGRRLGNIMWIYGSTKKTELYNVYTLNYNAIDKNKYSEVINDLSIRIKIHPYLNFLFRTHLKLFCHNFDSNKDIFQQSWCNGNLTDENKRLLSQLVSLASDYYNYELDEEVVSETNYFYLSDGKEQAEKHSKILEEWEF